MPCHFAAFVEGVFVHRVIPNGDSMIFQLTMLHEDAQRAGAQTCSSGLSLETFGPRNLVKIAFSKLRFLQVRAIRMRPRIASNRPLRRSGDVREGLPLAQLVQFLAGLLAASQVKITQH